MSDTNDRTDDDCRTEALEALHATRAASRKKGIETQALWDAVSYLEAGLGCQAETATGLTNKLSYLFVLIVQEAGL